MRPQEQTRPSSCRSSSTALAAPEFDITSSSILVMSLPRSVSDESARVACRTRSKSLRPMHPSPMVDTSGPAFPSVRVFICRSPARLTSVLPSDHQLRLQRALDTPVPRGLGYASDVWLPAKAPAVAPSDRGQAHRWHLTAGMPGTTSSPLQRTSDGLWAIPASNLCEMTSCASRAGRLRAGKLEWQGEQAARPSGQRNMSQAIARWWGGDSGTCRTGQASRLGAHLASFESHQSNGTWRSGCRRSGRRIRGSPHIAPPHLVPW
jgi:hypothetical protein